jgi:2,5-diketo-D-gluconate reductase A
MAVAKTLMYKLNNGIDMPTLGFGVFNSEPKKTAAAVRLAVVDGWIPLIDTAASYMNERQVGEGVRSSGISREQIS